MKGLREVGPNPVTKAYLIALMVLVDPGILNVNNILSEYSCKNIILRLKKNCILSLLLIFPPENSYQFYLTQKGGLVLNCYS